jgi:hypothetical protein
MNLLQLQQVLELAVHNGASADMPVVILSSDMNDGDYIGELSKIHVINSLYQADNLPHTSLCFNVGDVLLLSSASAVLDKNVKIK